MSGEPDPIGDLRRELMALEREHGARSVADMKEYLARLALIAESRRSGRTAVRWSSDDRPFEELREAIDAARAFPYRNPRTWADADVPREPPADER